MEFRGKTSKVRPEIAVEIRRAQAAGQAWTPWRRFYDMAEREGQERCHCGHDSAYVSYCTAGEGRAVACLECMEEERRRG